jgi:hypothetical protein
MTSNVKNTSFSILTGFLVLPHEQMIFLTHDKMNGHYYLEQFDFNAKNFENSGSVSKYKIFETKTLISY